MLYSPAHATNASLTTGASHGPRGFTLVELLVASTIGLMVMASLATLLGLFSRTASSTQSIIDMTHRLRVVGDRLRKDLAGVTCKLEPPVSPDSDSGYFEIIEGPATDTASWNSLTNKWIPLVDTNNNNVDWKGDWDDILLFTTRNSGEPFVGRYDAETIQANAAEVAWFVLNGNLYRRQLLIVPYVGRDPFLSGTNSISSGSLKFDLASFTYDLSLRQKNNFIYPNSLSDLSKSENRFRHVLDSSSGQYLFFPLAKGLIADGTSVNSQRATFNEPGPVNAPAREGEDIVLRNVLSFDVRVFDPDAWVKTHPDVATPLSPGDLGYYDTKAGRSAARGAYVDMGWGIGQEGVPASSFDIFAQAYNPGFDNRFPGSEDKNKDGVLDAAEDSFVNGAIDVFTAFQGWGLWPVSRAQPYATRDLDDYPLTYDTWSTHYESNGIDDDADGLVDEGTNGADDNGDGIPDDPAERETSPPYPVPLRGIEVRIRCIEPNTKEIRQITIRHAFQ